MDAWRRVGRKHPVEEHVQSSCLAGVYSCHRSTPGSTEVFTGNKNMTFLLQIPDKSASAGRKHLGVRHYFGGVYEVSNRFAEIRVRPGNPLRGLLFGYRAG